MSWIVIAGIIFAVYSFLLATTAVVSRNVEAYSADGYVDINLNWIVSNVFYFIGQLIFPPIKYTIVLAIILVCLGLVFLLAMLCADDLPFGDKFPDFMDDWWYAEACFWTFVGLVIVKTWKLVSDTTKWFGKHLKKWKDMSFFTIGKKR